MAELDVQLDSAGEPTCNKSALSVSGRAPYKITRPYPFTLGHFSDTPLL